MHKETKIILIALGAMLVFYAALHAEGIHIPYHQDEYKWPSSVGGEVVSAGAIPHPPLSILIYRAGEKLFGPSNLRVVPAFFGILDLLLLFVLGSLLFGKRAGLLAAAFASISYYFLLSTLMVDIDGAILPFFLLLMLISYVMFLRTASSTRRLWLTGILVFAALGCLVKVSFALGIGALILDYAIGQRFFSSPARRMRSVGILLAAALGFGALLAASTIVFPFFHLGASLAYWMHFVKFSGRGWGHTFIECAKAFLYLSPLLIVAPFFVTRALFVRARIFWLFIGLGLFFYLIAFDFSTGTLDKYLEFLVVPLCLISGAVYAEAFRAVRIRSVRGMHIIAASSALVLLAFATQFLSQFVPPLYPKSAWLLRALSLKWNFVFPFTGGSGPTGFYVSFGFIGLSFLIALGLLIIARVGAPKQAVLIALLIVAALYNGVFIEEYLWGGINGSPYGIAHDAILHIAEDKTITAVVDYNDIAAYELQATGKYARRLYATPQFEATYRAYFANFTGDVLYIDIPPVDSQSFYGQYFASCAPVWSERDRLITGTLFACKPDAEGK